MLSNQKIKLVNIGLFSPHSLLTFNQVIIGFSPRIAVLWCKDANRFLIWLQRRIPDLLQLHVNLIHCQWGAVAVVHIQDKELGEKREAHEQRGQVFPLHKWFWLYKIRYLSTKGEGCTVILYLKVVDHGDVRGRCLPSGIMYNCISLGSRHTTGGQDPIILVHTQRLPTQIFYWQSFTMTQKHVVLLIFSFEKPILFGL